MLKNFFSISKGQVAVLTTLVIIVVLGAGYFFIYIPGNEKALQAQRFRALQNIDKNIREKTDNSIALLNNLLVNYQDGNDSLKEHIKDYISHYSVSSFTLLQPVKYISNKMPVSDSTAIITTDSISQEILLSLIKITHNDTSSIGMKFSFAQFISYLLPVNVFDQYIVFSNNKTIFQTFQAGISYADQDSLLTTTAGIRSPRVIALNISGTDYKMFLQPFSTGSTAELLIGGLLTNRHYQFEKNQLPTPVILMLVTILLIIVVSFPLLKLYQMGSKDRLTLGDGVSSIIVAMLLISLLFFTFFKYNKLLRSEDPIDSKSILAERISNTFKKEIETAYEKITALDQMMQAQGASLKNNIVNLGKDSMVFSEPKTMIPEQLKQAILNTCSRFAVKQIYWLDSTGHEVTNWTTEAANAPHGNYNTRDYFKKIMSRLNYTLNNNAGKKFYLDHVVSHTTGTFSTILSIPSAAVAGNGNGVAAMSVKIESLDSVIIPSGFLFAVIDNTGRVLYHSDKSKNLNENLLNEFSSNEALKGFINARSNDTFTTKYFGNKYNVLISPVTGLPYHILIFGNTIYKETRDAENYSFTVSMLLLFFLFLVLQLLAVFLVSARRSFFKNQLFDTSWIGPKISSNKEYVLSALFNITAIISLLLVFSHRAFLLYFFMLLFAVVLMPFFLNKLFAIRYREEKRNSLQFKKTALWCLGILLALIELGAARLLDIGHFGWLLLYETVLIATALLLYWQQSQVLNACRRLKNKMRFLKQWSYIGSFTLMCVTRLIVTSGIPIVFFYYSSYNYE